MVPIRVGNYFCATKEKEISNMLCCWHYKKEKRLRELSLSSIKVYLMFCSHYLLYFCSGFAFNTCKCGAICINVYEPQTQWMLKKQKIFFFLFIINNPPDPLTFFFLFLLNFSCIVAYFSLADSILKCTTRLLLQYHLNFYFVFILWCKF